MTRVEIQVENGRVTIQVGAEASSKANGGGKLTAKQGAPAKFVGGDVGSESGYTGGSAPGSGVLVIGPIVVDGCAADSGHTGGDVGSESGYSGGSTDGGEGVVVIGPIVVTCGGSQGGTTPPPTVTHMGPDDEE